MIQLMYEYIMMGQMGNLGIKDYIFFYTQAMINTTINRICSLVFDIPRSIIAAIRLLIVAILIIVVWITNDYIYPYIIVTIIRRYIICLTNLVCLRTAMFVLGITKIVKKKFDDSNRYSFMSTTNRAKHRFGSGWLGVSNFMGLISVLEFTCYCSPIYCRIIQYHQDHCDCLSCNPKEHKQLGKQGEQRIQDDRIKILYERIGFMKAVLQGLGPFSFNPKIIKGKLQLRKYQIPPVSLHSLYSESSISLQGPVVIFLPHINLKSQLGIPDDFLRAARHNTNNYSRNSLAFYMKPTHSYQTTSHIFNQCKYFNTNCLDIQYGIVQGTSHGLLHRYKMYQNYGEIGINQYYQGKGYDVVKGVRQFCQLVQKERNRLEVVEEQEQEDNGARAKKKNRRSKNKYSRSCR